MLAFHQTASLLAILGCLPSATAQDTMDEPAEQRRSELRGIVRSSDGKGVPDAIVEAWLRPCVVGTPLGTEDFIACKTDKRGRFRAKILDGYSYSAVARWVDESKEPRQSMLVEGCRGGSLLRLEQSARGKPTKLEVTLTFDRAKYALFGDVRAMFFVDGINRRVLHEAAFASGVAQEITIPFSDSEGRFKVVVRDDRGPIHQTTLSARESATWNHAVSIGPPLEFRVVDADRKPIEGAEIASMQVPREGWRVDAVTDAKGTASTSSATKTANRWLVRVRAEGYRESLAFRSDSAGNINGKVVSPWPANSAVEIVLEKQAPLEGQLLDHRGRGIPGIRVAFSRDIALHTSASSRRGFGSIVEVFTTDKDGRYVMPALAQADGARWSTLLPPQILAALTPAAEPDALPSALLDLTPLAGGKSPSTDPVRLDLRTWKAVPYKIQLPGGVPARGAAILAVSDLSASPSKAIARAARTDRRGSCVLFDFDPKPATIAFLEGVGWARLDSQQDAGIGKDGVRAIELTPFTKRAVRIVDSKGKPVAGASVSITGSSWSGNSIDLDIARAINAMGLSATSDASGTMTLWSIDIPNLQHRLRFRKGSAQTIQPLAAPTQEAWVIELPSG